MAHASTAKRKVAHPAAKVYPDPRFAPDPAQNETATADQPSQFKNNMHQITQPTGHGVAGGKLPPVGETGNELAPNTEGMIGVILNNNYHPEDRFTVISTPHETAPAGDGRKLLAGTTVWLPIAEARKLTDDGRAAYSETAL
jgi:hypothetical protein